MSATIGNLVDRVYREYLEPMDDLQSYTLLTSGISDSATTVAFNSDLLTTEEEDVMDSGTVIQINQELMLCNGLDTVNNNVTVVRGVRGTTATAHTAGDTITIAPPFPRKNVFDAVCDQIKNLYPTLFAVDTQTVVVGNGYTLLGSYDAPADYNYLIAPIKAISQYTDFSSNSDTTDVIFRGVAVEMIDLPNSFTYTDDTGTERTIGYTTGPNVVHALQFAGIASGHTAIVTFKKKFKDPTAESNTLVSIGLEDEYEPIIMAGVAAHMLSGRDIPSATTDYITDQLATQNFPVDSSTRVRNSLLAYQRALIQQARKDLRARYPEPVSINNIVY
jgi:hypothetical protein